MAGGPRIRHLDEFPWQEVRRQQHGGRTASVREKWLDFSPRFLSLYARWDPGMIVQPHGHNSNHVVFVLDGEMTCGDVHCPAGTHIALEPDARQVEGASCEAGCSTTATTRLDMNRAERTTWPPRVTSATSTVPRA